MTIKAVKFNNQIDILQKTTARRAGGAYSERWTVYAQKFAYIKHIKASPEKEANILDFRNFAEIVIRYDKNILEFDKQNIRIRFNDNYYFVGSIIDKNIGLRYLSIWATENEKARVTVS